MKFKRESFYLLHILDACDAIASYFDGIGKDEFLSNRMRQDAVVRQIQIIGEAVKHISPETQAQYPQIIWKEIAGMRNRIIHAYFEVDLEIVWMAATKDVPELKNEMLKVLPEIQKIESLKEKQ
ncbi:MAG TPA: DUF86 domain-containing protein [Pyrinomonadaceae bacterium]|jgi:uncharacterized protein with HEPN domain